jgi:hypothetical protein
VPGWGPAATAWPRSRGIAYVRTLPDRCPTGFGGRAHPRKRPPAWRPEPLPADPPVVHHLETDLVVIGGGRAGRAVAAEAEAAGRQVTVLDAAAGDEVVAVYAGITIVVRRVDGMLHVRAREVVVATGAAEVQPACPGNTLAGLLTPRAAAQLHTAGVSLGTTVSVGEPPPRVRPPEPTGSWSGSRARTGDRGRHAGRRRSGRDHPCDTLILNLGRAPRDVLARMADDLPVRVVGLAADSRSRPRPRLASCACAWAPPWTTFRPCGTAASVSSSSSNAPA